MPPKSAEKKPAATGGKAPATKTPTADKKKGDCCYWRQGQEEENEEGNIFKLHL